MNHYNEYNATVFEILCGLVREKTVIDKYRSRVQEYLQTIGGVEIPQDLLKGTTDDLVHPPSINVIQTVIDVLFRRGKLGKESQELYPTTPKEEGDTTCRVRLRNAFLCGIDFTDAIMKWPKALLQGVVLVGARLENAHLQGANLWNAHLERTRLRGAHLQRAVLRKAHFQGADLTDADLQGADLRDVNFQGACLKGCFITANMELLRGMDMRGVQSQVSYSDDDDASKRVRRKMFNSSSLQENMMGIKLMSKQGHLLSSAEQKRFWEDYKQANSSKVGPLSGSLLQELGKFWLSELRNEDSPDVASDGEVTSAAEGEKP